MMRVRARQGGRAVGAAARLGLALLLGLISASIAAPVRADTAWVTQTVDAPQSFRHMSQRSLCLDAEGRPHIAYGADRLYYAWKDGASWRAEVVDDAPGVGQYASIGLDANGYAHISYYDSAQGDLRYARQDETGWHVEVVDDDNDMGLYTSLAVDVSGYAHISYYDATDEELKYTSWSASGRNTQSVDKPGNVGLYTSLALDADGRAHISYYDDTAEYLKYAHQTGSGWQIERVDTSSQYVGRYTSIALDGNGYPHIAYQDWWNERLKYAQRQADGWHIEVVDDLLVVGEYASLALDAANYPHIAYYDAYRSDLKYAVKGAAGWTTVSLIEDGNVGQYASLAVDSGGNPHISYYDETHMAQQYAHLSTDGWQVELVGQDEVQGEQPSLAVDVWGDAHASFYDPASGDLRYAQRSGIAWSVKTLDSAGDVGQNSTLVLGGDGRPRVTYYDATQGDLKYAYEDGSGWQTRVLDADGDVGRYSAQAIFTSVTYPISTTPVYTDYVHIGYYDAANGAVKYALLDGNAVAPTIEIVDDQGDAGQFVSVALSTTYGSLVQPYLSYYVADTGDLRCAWWDGAAWVTKTLETDGDVGQYTSLDIDPNAQLHLSYYDATDGDLRYAWFESGRWFTQTVDATGNVGQHCILQTALATYSLTGTTQSYYCPHIIYYDATNGAIKHAAKVKTATDYSWHIETLAHIDSPDPAAAFAMARNRYLHLLYGRGDALRYAHQEIAGSIDVAWHDEAIAQRSEVGDAGWYTSIAQDQWARPHISYQDRARYHLKHAYYDGWRWFVETVDDEGVTGYYTDIAVDANGRPHISYYGDTDLKYACKGDDGWQIHTVASEGNVGLYTSMALDSSQQPHIAYYDNNSGKLKYAYKDPTDSIHTGWHTTTVTSTGAADLYISLALDAADRPHIAYYDPPRARIKVVHKDDARGWVAEIVSEEEWARGHCSLVVDSDNAMHIAYYGDRTLRYAYYIPGYAEWVDDEADGADQVGLYTSIAVNRHNQPRILYWDALNGDLKYARKSASDDWEISVVDEIGKVGEYAALVMYDKGSEFAQASYYDATNGDLRYASRGTPPAPPTPTSTPTATITPTPTATPTSTPPQGFWEIISLPMVVKG